MFSKKYKDGKIVFSEMLTDYFVNKLGFNLHRVCLNAFEDP